MLFLFALLAIPWIYAQPPFKNIDDIQNYFEQQIKAQDLTAKRRYHLYLLAGRELFNYGEYSFAKKYYQKALETNFDANHSEAYINLSALSIVSKQKPDTINHYARMVIDYFRANPQHKTPEINGYLDFLKITFLKQPHKGTEEKVLLGPYAPQALNQKIVDLIKQKKFAIAFKIFPVDNLKEGSLPQKVTYDALHVMVKKQSVKSLFCLEDYNRYPNAFSYSIILCKGLKHYLKEGKVKPSHLQELKSYFSKNAQDRDFLFIILDELSKA